jgi:hypothetical protein
MKRPVNSTGRFALRTKLAAVALKPDSGATMLISGMVSPHTDAIIEALRSVADPSRSAAMRAYMRDQFEFLGIGTPRRRAATKGHLELLAILPASLEK